MVKDFLQDSFEQIVFILRSRCKGVRFEHMANSGGETGACLLGTRDFVLRALVLFDAGNNHLFICGQRLRSLKKDFWCVNAGLDELVCAGFLRLQLSKLLLVSVDGSGERV